MTLSSSSLNFRVIGPGADKITDARAADSRLRPAADATLRVEWRPLTALADIVPQWKALAERAIEPNVFYEPSFALPAAQVFGEVGAGLVWSQNRLLGLFPGRIERMRYGLPLPVLVGWTHSYGPLGTPLVDRDHAVPALAAWLDHVAGDLDLPGLWLLPLVPDEGPFASALGQALSGAPSALFGSHQRALLAPEGDRAGYLTRALGHKKHKELRRQRRRLEDTGTVEMQSVMQPSSIVAALADFLALEAGGWKGRAGTAAIGHADIRHFMERAVEGLAAEGKARVDRMLLDGRPIAALVTLRSGDVNWTWKIAYDEAFSRASPGVQLMHDLTEAVLGDPGVARADSCATAGHPMIDHLWRERLALSDRLIAMRPGRAFAIARRLEALRRAAIAGAKALRDRIRGQ